MPLRQCPDQFLFDHKKYISYVTQSTFHKFLINSFQRQKINPKWAGQNLRVTLRQLLASIQ
jgi:hypothetical protein